MLKNLWLDLKLSIKKWLNNKLILIDKLQDFTFFKSYFQDKYFYKINNICLAHSAVFDWLEVAKDWIDGLLDDVVLFKRYLKWKYCRILLHYHILHLRRNFKMVYPSWKLRLIRNKNLFLWCFQICFIFSFFIIIASWQNIMFPFFQFWITKIFLLTTDTNTWQNSYLLIYNNHNLLFSSTWFIYTFINFKEYIDCFLLGGLINGVSTLLRLLYFNSCIIHLMLFHYYNDLISILYSSFQEILIWSWLAGIQYTNNTYSWGAPYYGLDLKYDSILHSNIKDFVPLSKPYDEGWNLLTIMDENSYCTHAFSCGRDLQIFELSRSPRIYLYFWLSSYFYECIFNLYLNIDFLYELCYNSYTNFLEFWVFTRLLIHIIYNYYYDTTINIFESDVLYLNSKRYLLPLINSQNKFGFIWVYNYKNTENTIVYSVNSVDCYNIILDAYYVFKIKYTFPVKNYIFNYLQITDPVLILLTRFNSSREILFWYYFNLYWFILKLWISSVELILVIIKFTILRRDFHTNSIIYIFFENKYYWFFINENFLLKNPIYLSYRWENPLTNYLNICYIFSKNYSTLCIYQIVLLLSYLFELSIKINIIISKFNGYWFSNILTISSLVNLESLGSYWTFFQLKGIYLITILCLVYRLLTSNNITGIFLLSIVNILILALYSILNGSEPVVYFFVISELTATFIIYFISLENKIKKTRKYSTHMNWLILLLIFNLVKTTIFTYFYFFNLNNLTTINTNNDFKCMLFFLFFNYKLLVFILVSIIFITLVVISIFKLRLNSKYNIQKKNKQNSNLLNLAKNFISKWL